MSENFIPSREFIEQIESVNLSINRQSVELGSYQLKLREIESGLKSMYEYRKKIMATELKRLGIDQERVTNIRWSEDKSKMLYDILEKI